MTEEIYHTYRSLEKNNLRDIYYCNEAYKALFEEKQSYVDLNVSANYCYNDGSYPLYAIMALSRRGYNVEYYTHLTPTKHDENNSITACYINAFIRVSLSERKPTINPTFCKLPEDHKQGIVPLEYATEFVNQVNKWLAGIE